MMDEASRALRCLQRYPRGRLIGAGTFAEVFESADLSCHTISHPVALKRNRLGQCRDDKGIVLSGLADVRAMEDAWAQASLRCSGCHDLGSGTSGWAFMPRPIEVFVDKSRLHVALDRARADLHSVMKALQLRMQDPGGTLAAAGVAPPPLLPPAVIASIMRCVLAALADLHAAGYAHQDVKPGNVLLLAPGTCSVLGHGGHPSPAPGPRIAPVLLSDLGMSDRLPDARELSAAVLSSAAAEVVVASGGPLALPSAESSDGGRAVGGAAATDGYTSDASEASHGSSGYGGSPGPSVSRWGGGSFHQARGEGGETVRRSKEGRQCAAHELHASRAPPPQVVTIGYRAPELLFGARTHGHSVDEWAAGVLLLELLRLSARLKHYHAATVAVSTAAAAAPAAAAGVVSAPDLPRVRGGTKLPPFPMLASPPRGPPPPGGAGLFTGAGTGTAGPAEGASSAAAPPRGWGLLRFDDDGPEGADMSSPAAFAAAWAIPVPSARLRGVVPPSPGGGSLDGGSPAAPRPREAPGAPSGDYPLIDGTSEIGALATIHRLWGPPLSHAQRRALQRAQRQARSKSSSSSRGPGPEAPIALPAGVWPGAALLPGYMEFTAACDACGCAAGRPCSPPGKKGEEGGSADASRVTPATAPASVAHPGNAAAAAAVSRAPALPAWVLPETRAGCCSCPATSGSGAPEVGRPPLWHASSVAALAAWAGLGDDAAALQTTSTESPAGSPQPPLAADTGSASYAQLFDLALRLAALDPGRRLGAAEALRSHAALALPGGGQQQAQAQQWEPRLRAAMHPLVDLAEAVAAARTAAARRVDSGGRGGLRQSIGGALAGGRLFGSGPSPSGGRSALQGEGGRPGTRSMFADASPGPEDAGGASDLLRQRPPPFMAGTSAQALLGGTGRLEFGSPT